MIRSHIVPKLLLQRFANEHGQLRELDRADFIQRTRRA
jgi:hypothetical protein